MTVTVESTGLFAPEVAQMGGSIVSRRPLALRHDLVQDRETPTDDAKDSDFGSLVSESTTTDRRGYWVVRRPIVESRTRYEFNRRFKTLARWEGAVTEVFDTYFVADVVDLDADETATVEFDLAEISESDRTLCRPGALFYWSVGYDIKESGQLSRASVVRFRRLGPGTGAA